ncbi:hypothetical protein LQV63_23140 [Paenibacillus profundus]|uniref:Uncharacterized protein n=1 Tax=Paenibacillus profundus TaxID=1173085 RepID=A0ABS8YK46_9BACL|nr:hypothetical protein [Paenibacillus profundus]MCE5172181.1 hypothetical protein [Paenibacillus profundus]
MNIKRGLIALLLIASVSMAACSSATTPSPNETSPTQGETQDKAKQADSGTAGAEQPSTGSPNSDNVDDSSTPNQSSNQDDSSTQVGQGRL